MNKMMRALFTSQIYSVLKKSEIESEPGGRNVNSPGRKPWERDKRDFYSSVGVACDRCLSYMSPLRGFTNLDDFDPRAYALGY